MSSQPYTLAQFVAATRRSLKEQPGPAGVEEVRQHLNKIIWATRPPLAAIASIMTPKPMSMCWCMGASRRAVACPTITGPVGSSMASTRTIPL